MFICMHLVLFLACGIYFPDLGPLHWKKKYFFSLFYFIVSSECGN